MSDEDMASNTEPQPKFWFKCDIPTLKPGSGELKTTSWYNRFAQVCSGVLIQCMLLHLGLQNRGGQKVPYDHTRLRQIIERIPTPDGSAAGTARPAFPIATRKVSDWVIHLNRDASEQLTPAPEPVKTIAQQVAEHDDKFAEIKSTYDHNDGRDDLSAAQLLERQRQGIKQTAESLEKMSAGLRLIGTTVPEFLETDFLHTAFYPPAPMAKPEWTPFLERMADSNVYGQVELVHARLRQVEQGLRLVRDMCETHINDLAERRKTLLAQAELIHEVQRKLGIEVDDTMKLSNEVYKLNASVSEALQNPKVLQYVNFHDPSRKSFFNIQPGAASPKPSGMHQPGYILHP
jgi:hypothetical protein